MSEETTDDLFTGVLTPLELGLELLKYRLKYNFDVKRNAPICKSCNNVTKMRRVGFPAGSGSYIRYSIPHCPDCEEEPPYLGANIDLPDNGYFKEGDGKAT